MKFHTKKAFTLVEMLIVIVIIGILAAALIPKLTGIQGRARDVARKAHLQQLSTALATYSLDNGKYPVVGGHDVSANNIVPLVNQTTVIYNQTRLALSNPQPITPTGPGTITATAGGYRVQDSLANLVSEGILKDLFVETYDLGKPYTYAPYNGGKMFSLMSANEGGGKNANFSIHLSITNASSVNNVSQLTSKLCLEVAVGATPTGVLTTDATAASNSIPVGNCVARAGDAIYVLMN